MIGNGDFRDVKRYGGSLWKRYKKYSKSQLVDAYYELEENRQNLNNYALEDLSWLEGELMHMYNGHVPDKPIKIYRQYSGCNNDTYYYTFNECEVNHVGKCPVEVSLTKEIIVNAILDNQIVDDGKGNYCGNEYLRTKTQGMKMEKVKLIEILKEVYTNYKTINKEEENFENKDYTK